MSDDLNRLRAGDTLLYDGNDLVVLRLDRYSEGASFWLACQLGQSERPDTRLIVDTRNDREVLLGQCVEGLPLLGTEPPKAFDHEDRIYRLQRTSVAQLANAAESRHSEPSSIRLWEYSHQRIHQLRLLLKGNEWSAIAGILIPRHFIEVLPAPRSEPT